MRYTLKTRRGFTLTELVVVMAVIALLAALLLPMVFRSMRAGKRARLAADLQAIETGLNAYKADFGDYPRFPVGYDPANQDTQKDRGARLLCRALLSPGAENGAAGSGFDGFNGPGFRVARRPGPDGVLNTNDDTLLGKTYGPYIVPDKFKTTEPNDASAKLLDNEGHIILYYPARPGNVDINTVNAAGFVNLANPNPATPYTAPQIAPLYEAYDNLQVEATTAKPFPPGTTLLPVSAMKTILGDKNGDGAIDNGENAVTQAPYLLWSAGVDGIYGFAPNKDTTDDVTNFEIPPGLFKN
jgi:prepilin-type N-terminal cleavage/methylation domain-containing protein